MAHIKKIDEFNSPSEIGVSSNELKKCYLYKGYHEVYISDRPIEGFSNIRPKEYRSFNDAYEAALKLEVDTLFSETLKDEVCDFYGDRDYYEDNKEFFFNPDKPINESIVNEGFGDQRIENEISAFNKQAGMLREKLTANIVEILKRHNGEINIGEFEYDGYIDPIMVSVSNNDYGYVSSSVSSVKLNGKSFTLDTDENPKYDAENLNVYEVIDIYEALAMIEEHPEWSEK